MLSSFTFACNAKEKRSRNKDSKMFPCIIFYCVKKHIMQNLPTYPLLIVQYDPIKYIHGAVKHMYGSFYLKI